jgi:cyanophycinase
MKKNNFGLLCNTLIIIAILSGCQSPETGKSTPENVAKGKLYIIGGGKRPPEMIREMISLSGIDKAGFAIVLPMASEEPDTAFYYSRKQFREQGIENVFRIDIEKGEPVTGPKIDSIINSSLIYITGGDQVRFMEAVLNTPYHDAIREAYLAGAVVAGTSAGAAVMSRKMITGREHKYPEYTGSFRTIEAGNIEIAEGLGLITTAIIDQHFVYRMRMNRLISVAIENPDEICIGIDEATAIVVEGDSARVSGISQVIILENPGFPYSKHNDLLGIEGLHLRVFLPGQRFSVRKSERLKGRLEN